MQTPIGLVSSAAKSDSNRQDVTCCIRPEKTIIYEMHVGGFTRHPASGVSQPGTFLGVIEKIPYLALLGVTHVELLPVMAFDEQDVPPGVAELGLENYWGYSTHSYFESPQKVSTLPSDTDNPVAECRVPADNGPVSPPLAIVASGPLQHPF